MLRAGAQYQMSMGVIQPVPVLPQGHCTRCPRGNEGPVELDFRILKSNIHNIGFLCHSGYLKLQLPLKEEFCFKSLKE